MRASKLRSVTVGCASALCFALVAPCAFADIGQQLDRILAGDHRNPKNAARDQYRHPKETLMFFGIQPGMTVVEVWPSAGWWTEILAPLLKDQGKYYAAYFATEWEKTPDFLKAREKEYDAMLAARTDLYGKVVKTKLLAPQWTDIAPRGSADMVLTFRNVHNWAKAGNAEPMFQAFWDALKPGGVLGVKDHRANPGTPFQQQIDSGYMTEEYVISTAQKIGFKLRPVGGTRRRDTRTPRGRVDASADAQAQGQGPRQVRSHRRERSDDADVREAEMTPDRCNATRNCPWKSTSARPPSSSR
jgi:predicted methyltransferase